VSQELVFTPGPYPANPGPLARFLPPLPDQVVSRWLAGMVPPGAWVLDPFCAAPRQALEAARAGYRVLVAANNPIGRFLLEMGAAAPPREAFQSALADLAGARVGDQRLELYLQSLYHTECDACGETVQAAAFIWERGAAGPSSRVYQCPRCGEGGEKPTTPADLRRASQLAATAGLHHARALERVTSLNDPDREHAEEALAAYLPRAVLAVFTLINKLDGLGASPQRLNLLRALLLSACDQANTLWPHPSGRARPRQLSVPPRFREHNLWLALENAIQAWETSAAPVPLLAWPPPPGGAAAGSIVIYEGRLRDLAEQLTGLEIAAVLAPMPRPNQAFWTLSALWAGWLWGRDAVAPFKSVLRRRRYDWGWHATALESAWQSLIPHLKPGVPCLGLIGEAESGFLSAALTAADRAGFALDGLALRHEDEQAQIAWRCALPPETPPAPCSADQVEDSGRAAILDHLRRRNQPAPHLPLHAAALQALAGERALSRLPAESPAQAVSLVQASLQAVFSRSRGLQRFGESEHSHETGLYWLRETPKAELSLADRAEIAIVTHLVNHPNSSLQALDEAACRALPGLLTPDPELIQTILESYGEQAGPGGQWRLRSEDQPRARRAELAEILQILATLGARLGYTASGEAPRLWLDGNRQPQAAFYPLASANLGRIVYAAAASAPHQVIVLPGGRANLVMYKLSRDPALQQAINAGWRILKFRHLRRLAEDPMLSPELFAEQLLLDPLTYTTPQLRLL
jgi:hypothetical protein